MTGMSMRREHHVSVADFMCRERRSDPACAPRRVRQTRIDIERDVGEAHDETGVAQPPQRRGNRKGSIDLFDKFAPALHRLKHVSVFYRPAALVSLSRIAVQSGASGGNSTAIHGQFS